MTIRRSKLIETSALATVTALLAGACSPPSPKVMAPPERFATVDARGGNFREEFNPKVDILFVVDNSASMLDDQERLSANIDKFVAQFAGNQLIDYHIGIVTVFDSTRQKQGNQFFWPLGQLRPLKSPTAVPAAPIEVHAKNADGSVRRGRDGKPLVLCTTSDELVTRAGEIGTPGFVTRETPEGLAVLQASLKVGVQCLDHGGPEYEELFSPIVAALSEPMMSGANRGFYREDAHLAVILISDADASNADPSEGEVAQYLKALKQVEARKQNSRSLVSTFAVTLPVGDRSCERDPGLKNNVTGAISDPLRVHQFLSQSRGTAMSLCDAEYGAKLAGIGADIRRRIVARAIKLNAIPEIGTIKVMYGTQEIPQDAAKGWTYDAATNSIVVSGDIEIRRESGAELHATFIPVNMNNLNNGRAQRQGLASPAR